MSDSSGKYVGDTYTITGTSTTFTKIEYQDLCYLCEVEISRDALSIPMRFCSFCRAALMEVRKKYLAQSIKELWPEYEREEEVKLHQGFTESGKLVHAVRFVKRGEYQPRAICGVRIAMAKSRMFESVERGMACSRCLGSLDTD